MSNRPVDDARYCRHCGEWIEYVQDNDGVWAECGCDAGYLTNFT